LFKQVELRGDSVKPRDAHLDVSAEAFEERLERASPPDLKDPKVVLSLLEADQVVAAKQRTHFGRRKLSLGARMMLWGLRIYVVIMLILVVISAVQAIHSTP
jgi:hypothetical protein